ncbi:hypothetical protein PIB30_033524 [Stylosanthes scabra]|uniref:3-beta hydroxysteroid dehydrogenase/isomerase domain-containing protein n=1 Tax=Stylosanthes scabra TaxID=79078 RepID=A0ABU6RD10_9FABA|nr:hypothetical protein [Stylosanthes scabra]
MEEEKGTVCVTGGEGFVASWLIKNLLQHGYYVRATVRCRSSADDNDEGIITTEKKEDDLSYLRKLEGASERLKIFHGELEELGSYDKAIEGCVGVFHLAHPMDVNGEEDQEKVTKRAMEGTLGILKACLQSKTVRRFVYTSSAVAVVFNNNGNN